MQNLWRKWQKYRLQPVWRWTETEWNCA